jgi:hypothetical protein
MLPFGADMNIWTDGIIYLQARPVLVVPIVGTQQTVQHDVEQIVHVDFDSESLPFVSEIHSFIFMQNHNWGSFKRAKACCLLRCLIHAIQ